MENKQENIVGHSQKNTNDHSITVPLKPLLTPAQKSMLEYGKIPDLISRFDLHPFSSPEAFINTRVHNRVQTLLAPVMGTKPDLVNTSDFAPLSDSGAAAVKAFDRKAKEDKLPPGYCLDTHDKPIFDKQWKAKGLKEKDLPHDHPDYAPF